MEKGYNGWANYPTWCVNLWLSNEEPLYREALERVREAAEVAETHTTPKRVEAGDALREWVTLDLVPELGASFASDLLGWALGQVDWMEIADGWLEQVEEVV